mmetsp:Transcript_91808/g.182969  ORF Transcript_91808/g.182969 Transcript_91808/m.182969 type:complete len:422 (-) Transcript_91808:178-1443(-)
MMCTQMISTNSAGNITISWKKTDYDFDNDNFINYSSNRGCPNNTCTGGCYPITHEAGTFSKEDYRDLTLNKCVIYTPWDVSLSLWGATQGSNVRQINYGQHYPQKEKNEGNKSRGGGWVSGGAIAGIVIGVAAVIALIVFMATGGPKNMCKRDSGALTPPPATAVNEIYYTKSARSLSPHSFPSSTPGVDAEHNPLQRDVEMKPFRNGSQDPIGFSSSSNPDSVVEMPAPMVAGLLRDSFPISSLVVVVDPLSPLNGKTGKVVEVTEKTSSAGTGWVEVLLEHGDGNDGDTGLIKFQPQHLLAPGSFLAGVGGLNTASVTVTVAKQPEPAASQARFPNETSSSRVSAWDAQEVSDFIRNLGPVYSTYGDAFLEAGIDGATLMSVEDADLAEVIRSAGVTNRLHELRIKKGIQDLKLKSRLH